MRGRRVTSGLIHSWMHYCMMRREWVSDMFLYFVQDSTSFISLWSTMRCTTFTISYALCHDSLSHDEWETTEPSVYRLRSVQSEPKQILCPVLFSCVFFIVTRKGSHSPQVCLSHGYPHSLHRLFSPLIPFLLYTGNPNLIEYLVWISCFSSPPLPHSSYICTFLL